MVLWFMLADRSFIVCPSFTHVLGMRGVLVRWLRTVHVAVQSTQPSAPGQLKHSALPPKRGEDAGTGNWLIRELHLQRQWAIDRHTAGELEICGKGLCLQRRGCRSSPAGMTLEAPINWKASDDVKWLQFAGFIQVGRFSAWWSTKFSLWSFASNTTSFSSRHWHVNLLVS